MLTLFWRLTLSSQFNHLDRNNITTMSMLSFVNNREEIIDSGSDSLVDVEVSDSRVSWFGICSTIYRSKHSIKNIIICHQYLLSYVFTQVSVVILRQNISQSISYRRLFNCNYTLFLQLNSHFFVNMCSTSLRIY